jgi:hypothetical protein
MADSHNCGEPIPGARAGFVLRAMLARRRYLFALSSDAYNAFAALPVETGAAGRRMGVPIRTVPITDP